MNLVSCFKVLALVLLWKLDLFTCIESDSSRLPPTERNYQPLCAHNYNNCNNRYYGGEYGYRSYRRSRYHVANRGKIPPEPPPLFHHRSRPRNYSGYGFRGHGPTHFGSTYSSHHSKYDHHSHGGNFISLDISRTFTTRRYTFSHEYNMDVFRAIPPYLFSEVKHGPDLLWQYKGQGYPNKVTCGEVKGKPKVEVHFPEPPRRTAGKYRPPGFIYTNRDFVPGQHNTSFRVKAPNLTPTERILGQDVEFELLTVGDKVFLRPKHYPGTGASSSLLISVNVDRFESTDKVMYTYDPRTGIHSLKTREPFLINEIIQKGQIIWRAKNNRYGDRVILKYDEDGKPMSRVLYPDWAVFGMDPPYLSPHEVPKYRPSARGPNLHEQSPTSTPSDSEFKSKSRVPKGGSSPFDHSDNLEEPVTASPHLPDTIDTSFPPPSAAPPRSSDKKPFELDINSRDSTDQFECTYDSPIKTMTYVAKNLYRFSAIKYGANVLWSTHNPREYAHKVTLRGFQHRGMFHLAAHLDDRVISFYKDESVPWTEVDTSKANCLTLNVLSNFEAFFYTVEIAGEHKTFTAKEGFKFCKVRSGESWIWETIRIQEYSSKVVTTGDKRVSIYLDNEKLLNFVRVCRGCQGSKSIMCGLVTCGIYNCCAKRWKEVN
ncbi:hypothetical protein MACJ_002656 [Theileria orientalis]|uniref:Uncharacterized protein n=1 Tax=Theileria orientalis TaxID=68886 RepID=A0A976QVM6_THEOR|nr:hypothetical protein MACJ_002656 [Theileria orientalis]